MIRHMNFAMVTRPDQNISYDKFEILIYFKVQSLTLINLVNPKVLKYFRTFKKFFKSKS